jgi:hypothetical protein
LRRRIDPVGDEGGAANADGGARRLHRELFLVALAQQAGHRAQAALDQAEGGVVAVRLAGVVAEVVDLEGGRRLQRDFAVVDEFHHGVGVLLGHQRIAALDFRTHRQDAHGAVGLLGQQRAAQLDDGAGNLRGPAGAGQCKTAPAPAAL